MKKLEPMSASARELLDDVRDAHDPSDADRARVRRALMATVAGGAGLAAATTASSAAASTAATGAAVGGGLSLGFKIAMVVVVVGAVGGTVAVAPWEPSEPSRTAHPANDRAARADRDELAADEPTALAALPVARTTDDDDQHAANFAPDDAHAEDEPAGRSTDDEDEHAANVAPDDARAANESAGRTANEPDARAARGDAPTGIASAAGADPSDDDPTANGEASEGATPSSFAEELALLRRAQRAINGGDPDAALELLRQHATRFPDGVMVEEREAARVVALCDAERREEASVIAARFLRERSNSPLAARVRAACD